MVSNHDPLVQSLSEYTHNNSFHGNGINWDYNNTCTCKSFIRLCAIHRNLLLSGDSTEAVSAYIALLSSSCPTFPSRPFLISHLLSSGLVETCVAIGVVIGPFFVSTLAVQNNDVIAKRFDYPTVVLFSGNKEHEKYSWQKRKNNWK